MSKLPEVKYGLKGKSGKEYTFDIYSLDSSINKIGHVMKSTTN